ncbi:MAG: Lrp/AsnC family transcriptional regulator [Candidatus Nezhaarchaeota archaeon]|nr:Lrp/AsnC family transcriptional regulator [Candidatus Nezhaarchaeota archaeon]
MSEIDEIDNTILSILLKDSRTPYTVIAKKVGLSEAGVRKRIDRLVKMGIIKRFTIEIDRPAKVRAITLITADPSADTSEVSSKVREVSGVEKVFEVTGVYDVVAIISSPSISDVNKCIDELRRIKGVKSTNTMMVLREW